MSITRNQIYQRQTTLQEIGANGQQKLQNASVTVVGCGGLGTVAAVYLAASGVGHLHLIDLDVIGASNLHRQVFYTVSDIGKSKAKVLAAHIKRISPFVNVRYSKEAISKNTIAELLSDTVIVLDCTDQLSIKYLLNDFCIVYDKVLIYGSLYKFDGYIATFNLEDGTGGRTTNLRDAFPEIPTENIPNCSEIGTLNTIVGIIGMMQANEVLKIVTGAGNPLVNELLIYNSLDNSQFRMKLKPKSDNHEDRKRRIAELFKEESYEEVACEVGDTLEISVKAFKKLLDDERTTYQIISVIENSEQETPFQVDAKAPLSEFDTWISDEFNENEKYIFVCNRGISSKIAASQLKEDFPNVEVLSLEGGILEF